MKPEDVEIYHHPMYLYLLRRPLPLGYQPGASVAEYDTANPVLGFVAEAPGLEEKFPSLYDDMQLMGRLFPRCRMFAHVTGYIFEPGDEPWVEEDDPEFAIKGSSDWNDQLCVRLDELVAVVPLSTDNFLGRGKAITIAHVGSRVIGITDGEATNEWTMRQIAEQMLDEDGEADA